ncbi:MAG: hypothetical protein MJA83_10605, partial [Gammaproteobacteria bacterium]|nr:hypothetical protein [Gammaproteobacteria bacterium]
RVKAFVDKRIAGVESQLADDELELEEPAEGDEITMENFERGEDGMLQSVVVSIGDRHRRLELERGGDQRIAKVTISPEEQAADESA